MSCLKGKMSYNRAMSELPISCKSCGKDSMVDMEALDKKPVDKIASALGFHCSHCGAWVTVHYTTASLELAKEKLMHRSTTSAKFLYHFSRVMKKAEGIQERYG